MNVTASHSESGKREQRYFRTKDEALEFAAALKERAAEHGRNANTIAPGLAEQATAAARLLEGYDVTLIEVVRRFVEDEKAVKDSLKVDLAAERFKKAKEHLSPKQQQAIRLACDALAEDFPGRKMSSIKAAELLRHLEKHTGGSGSFNWKRRLLVTFWRWAAKPPRKWCQAEVAESLEVRYRVAPEIGILTAKQAAALLKAAEDHFPETVPGFAIALFTGMRQAELARLDPEDITVEGIRVPATKAKSKRRRFINMPVPLSAWLKAYPIGEMVLPANWRRKEKAVRRLAGWRVWSDLVPTLKFDPPMKAEPAETLPEWPDNALRHTHATVAIATGASLEQLTFEFGHSGGAGVLRSHYVGAMPKAEAVAILRIGPKGKKLPNLQVA